MKKKTITLALSLLCVAIVSASCNSDKSSSSNTSVVTDTSSSAAVSSTAPDSTAVNSSTATDKNKNTTSDTSVSDNNDIVIDTDKKVAIIPVTNDQGQKVTDTAGKPVTQIAVIDQSNKPVTDTMGNYVPPNVAGESVNFKYGSLLWMAGYHNDSNTGQHVFDVIKEDGKIFALTFKVNDKAASGDYEISFQRKTSSGSGAFSTDSGKGINTSYSSGIITVGSSTPQVEKDYSGFTCYFTNAAANPGDTVTIYGSIKNNSDGFAAFNTYFRYDSDAFTLQSIKAAGLIENSGEFMSS